MNRHVLDLFLSVAWYGGLLVGVSAGIMLGIALGIQIAGGAL